MTIVKHVPFTVYERITTLRNNITTAATQIQPLCYLTSASSYHLCYFNELNHCVTLLLLLTYIHIGTYEMK